MPGYLIPLFGYTPLWLTLSFGYIAAVRRDSMALHGFPAGGEGKGIVALTGVEPACGQLWLVHLSLSGVFSVLAV